MEKLKIKSYQGLHADSEQVYIDSIPEVPTIFGGKIPSHLDLVIQQTHGEEVLEEYSYNLSYILDQFGYKIIKK